MKPSSLHIRDEEGRLRYWWCALPAVPAGRDSASYVRLRRVWFDHTWRNHPFLNSKSEMHATVTIFENFSIFRPQDWVPALLSSASIALRVQDIEAVSWGYEVHGTSANKNADIAVHIRDKAGDAVLLIEAKRRGGHLKPGDTNPGSYLDLAAFSWADRRALIYLVDETDYEAVSRAIRDPEERSGVLSWQELGGLQIQLAETLGCSNSLRNFIAGAIQYHLVSIDILPSRLSSDYLSSEPSRDEINSRNEAKLTTREMNAQTWRIGGSF